MAPHLRTSLILLCLLLLTISLRAQSSRSFPGKAARKAFYQELAHRYNSENVRHIFESDLEGDFEDYVEGHSEAELMEEWDVIIHELLHGFDASNSEFNLDSYFLASGKHVKAERFPVFSSRELNGYVPKAYQDSIFRYGTYVGGRPATAQFREKNVRINSGGGQDITSISHGIFGMIEEFNAYYWGTLAQWELRAYFEETYETEDTEAWSDYKHSLLSNAMAYHEFRLFIAWYLNFARQQHPDLYEKLRQNRELRQAFSSIEASFGELMSEIEADLPQLDRLSGPDITDMLQSTGSDEEIRNFLLSNDVDIEAMGLKPGSPEWEALREEYLRAMGELKNTGGADIEIFHGQPKAQLPFLKRIFGEKEEKALAAFRLK